MAVVPAIDQAGPATAAALGSATLRCLVRDLPAIRYRVAQPRQLQGPAQLVVDVGYVVVGQVHTT
jgi:hypothetical protein